MTPSDSIKPTLEGNVLASTGASLESASWRLFNTFELLEAILLELDVQTLLLGQRVSWTWLNTIQSSAPLQRRLWMIPGKDVQQAQQQDDLEVDLEENVNWFLCRKINAKYGIYDPHRKSIPGITFVEIVRTEHINHFTAEGWIDERGPICEIRVVFEQGMHKPNKELMASWRRMFLLHEHDPHIRWSATIANEPPTSVPIRGGCVRGRWRKTKFYCPERLNEAPNMEMLLTRAIEYRKEWLKTRRWRPLREKICEQKNGEQRFLFSGEFLLIVLIGTGLGVVVVGGIIASPVLIPIWVPVVVHEAYKKRAKKKHEAQKSSSEQGNQ